MRRGQKGRAMRANGDSWAAGRSPGETWWLISRIEPGRAEAMTVRCGGREALALFGHREEAEMYLWSVRDGTTDNGWRVKESRRGEVISVLLCPHARLEAVALDPTPPAATNGTPQTSVDRQRFVQHLLQHRNGRPAPPDAHRQTAS